MFSGNFKEVCQITIMSDVGAAAILAVMGLVIFIPGNRRRALWNKLFMRAVLLTLLATVTNCVRMIFILHPEHITYPAANVLFGLELILMELGYFCLIRYLLTAGGKESGSPVRLNLVRIPTYAVCILFAVSIPTGFLFWASGNNHLVFREELLFILAAAPVLIGIIVCIISLWKRNKSLLSVFVFLLIMRMYLGFMLAESFSLSAVLALGLVYAYFSVHSRGSLFQIGSVIILLFIGATLMIGNYTMRSVSSFYLAVARETDGKNLVNVRKTLENMASFPWLVNYWIEHPDEINTRIDNEQDGMDDGSFDRLTRLVNESGKEMASLITAEDLSKMSDEDQLLFASVYYSVDRLSFEYDADAYSLDDMRLVAEDASGKLTIIFDANKEVRDSYSLGDEVDRKLLEESWDNYEQLAEPGILVPILDEFTAGDSFGYYENYEVKGVNSRLMFCMTVSSEEISEKLTFISGLRRHTIFILTIAATLILVLLFFTVLRPLRYVTRIVSEYHYDKNSEKTSENLKMIRSRNEIGVLAREFTSLTKEMKRYTEEVARMAADNERVSTELRTAAQIQEAALPDTFPAFPDRTDFDLFARMDPAKAVGGDFYDFFLIDENHLALLIADVSDKGVPAALFMMSAKNLINYRTKLGGTPAQILTEVNEQICTDRLTQMFVTVWMGILNLEDGVMTCTNAGHEYPVIRREGKFEVYNDKHGLVIGGMSGIKYKDYEVKLNPGDAVFVYTDGVPEANNADGEFYGMERLEEALNRAGNGTPEEILTTVRADVDAFVAGAAQFDDLTMLCLEYRGKTAGV